MKLSLEILLIALTYLLGSVPFGYIFTRKFTGQNILELGSGNIGSTNVKRAAGSTVALMTQLCDMLKGLLPVAFIIVVQHYSWFVFDDFFVYLIALTAILGHNFSIFMRFKGGKGVNTTLGTSILLSPIPVLVAVMVYYIVKWKTKYVSLGSICLSVSLPVCQFLIYKSGFELYYFIICALMIILMHTSNVIRLLNGEENKSQ